MAEAEPRIAAEPSGTVGRRRSAELGKRVAAALVLAPLALGAAYMGGWPFMIFWTIAAVGVLWEWMCIVAAPAGRAPAIAGGALLVTAAVLVTTSHQGGAVMVLVVGAIAAGLLAPAARRGWSAAGVVYAGALVLSVLLLRTDAAFGFLSIIFLFAVVWSTDILGYFVGRAVGGPKLWPRVSPKKTWSGALAGIAGAGFAAVVMDWAVDLGDAVGLVLVAAILSVASQGGDLFESAIKRRFGVKDAGHLIPGHGGLMDRLDGFITAAVLAAIVGVSRGHLADPAAGLLRW